MDAAKVFAAVNAGQTPEILRQIAELGIVFDESLGAVGLLKAPASQMRLRIDAATGKLAPTGEAISTGSPVCIVFLPAS
jgi:hypothetical protein